jgi:hypothetical protein
VTAERWDYGPEGREHPVEPGDLWRLGRHLFLCSDLMASGAFDALVASEGPHTLLYTDPPWGQGLLNGFRTKAGLGRADHEWIDLYLAAAALAGGVPTWMESGRRESDRIWNEVLTGEHVARYEITYYRRSPAVLHYSGSVPSPCDPTGLDDEETPGLVMRSYPTGLVVDPMAGRGTTAQRAEELGWRSLNNELNPHRLSAALARVARMSGDRPELLSRGLTTSTAKEA